MSCFVPAICIFVQQTSLKEKQHTDTKSSCRDPAVTSNPFFFLFRSRNLFSCSDIKGWSQILVNLPTAHLHRPWIRPVEMFLLTYSSEWPLQRSVGDTDAIIDVGRFKQSERIWFSFTINGPVRGRRKQTANHQLGGGCPRLVGAREKAEWLLSSAEAVAVEKKKLKAS